MCPLQDSLLYQLSASSCVYAICITCSAGTGRTGAFIALDTALGQARGERRMDIPDILTRLRNQRMKMVQTPVRDPALYHTA